jgi:hypothetical protein
MVIDVIIGILIGAIFVLLIRKLIDLCIGPIGHSKYKVQIISNKHKLISKNLLIKGHIREQYIIKEILEILETRKRINAIPPLIPPSWMNSIEEYDEE